MKKYKPKDIALIVFSIVYLILSVIIMLALSYFFELRWGDLGIWAGIIIGYILIYILISFLHKYLDNEK